MFIVLLEKISLMWRRFRCQERTEKFWTMLDQLLRHLNKEKFQSCNKFCDMKLWFLWSQFPIQARDMEDPIKPGLTRDQYEIIWHDFSFAMSYSSLSGCCISTNCGIIFIRGGQCSCIVKILLVRWDII